MKKILVSMGVFFSISILSALDTSYKDYGAQGTTYEIKDRNFLSLFHERVSTVDKKALQSLVLKGIKKGLVIKNKEIYKCSETRERFFTPTVTLKENIVLEGHVFKKKGTYNILEEVNQNINKYMFFLNTEHPLEEEFIKAFKNNDDDVINFVVNGSIEKTLKNKVPAYFANKEIVEMFDIKCTPSIVIQEGNRFKIKEYFLNEEDYD